MDMKSNRRTRRALLRSGVYAGSVLAVGWSCGSDRPFAQGRAASAGKSRIAIARDVQHPAGKTNPGQDAILKILDRALQTFFDCDNPAQAWQKVARTGEVVGLKVNCLAGKGISTSVTLVDAVCERLRQAGIRSIVIWDRLNADLESAGYAIVERGSGIRCFGNDTGGYESELAVFGSAGSLVATTLTRVCDVVINLPVLKDHGITGVTGALKNMFGAIHNPNKYHLDVGDPYVADVNMLPPIRQKVRLVICDALTAQYNGGPSFMPQWAWPYGGLIVGSDPVALDYVGWQIIEKKRAEKGMEPLRLLQREPTYIRTAADSKHRLGTCDPSRIEVVEA